MPRKAKSASKPNTGLTKWFKQDWRDVKTGKKCGRKSAKGGSKRPYPACRPAKAAARMTASEKRSMARKKNSSARKSWPVTPSGRRKKTK